MEILKNLKEIMIIDNVKNGFENINSGILVVESEEDIKKFIKEIDKPLAVDYYGNTIDHNAFSRLLSYLGEEEQKYLIELKKSYEDGIYFKDVEEKFLDITLKLSLEEILFSSFYLGDDITIWGNYNQRFVIFFKREEDLEILKIIATKNKVQIEDISIN